MSEGYVLAGAGAGCPSRVCLCHRTHLASVLSFLTWSLPGTKHPAQHSCFCALGTSLALTGQEKLCWCPLRCQQVPVWCAEPEDRVLSFPSLGYPALLRVLCNPVGKFAQWDHFWEFRSHLKVSAAGDLMRFCQLVAPELCVQQGPFMQSWPRGNILVSLVPRTS